MYRTGHYKEYVCFDKMNYMGKRATVYGRINSYKAHFNRGIGDSGVLKPDEREAFDKVMAALDELGQTYKQNINAERKEEAETAWAWNF